MEKIERRFVIYGVLGLLILLVIDLFMDVAVGMGAALIGFALGIVFQRNCKWVQKRW